MDRDEPLSTPVQQSVPIQWRPAQSRSKPSAEQVDGKVTIHDCPSLSHRNPRIYDFFPTFKSGIHPAKFCASFHGPLTFSSNSGPGGGAARGSTARGCWRYLRDGLGGVL